MWCWGSRINACGLGVCSAFINVEDGILKEIVGSRVPFLMESGMSALLQSPSNVSKSVFSQVFFINIRINATVPYIRL